MTTRSVTYDTPGSYTWTAPAGVTAVIAMIQGAGSGGGSGGGSSGLGGGGGGSGQHWQNKFIPCAGGTVAIVVGPGGTGANYSGPGTDGGDSSAANVIAKGSPVPLPNVGNVGGKGGGLRGGSQSVPALPGQWGTFDAPHSVGGAGGGTHNGSFPFDASGAPGCATVATGGNNSGPSFTGAGCAGASSPFGPGGNGGDRSLNAAILSGKNATGFGAGGGGGGSASSGDYGVIGQNGGNGKGGIVILCWTEAD